MTNPLDRGKGWISKLLVFITKTYGRFLIDNQLSVASAALIEKLISNGAVSAYVANLETGEMTEYHPDSETDRVIPMYDMIIQGVNRPILTRDEALKKTWVIESWRPLRNPRLQKFIFEGPMNT